MMVNDTVKPVASDETLEKCARFLEIIAGKGEEVNTWDAVKRIVLAERERVEFKIGDQIIGKWFDDDGTEYECPWDVVHFGTVKLADGRTTNGMFLQMHYADELAIPFSEKQQMELDENETVAKSGWYYYGATGSTTSDIYTALKLEPGSEIPIGSYAKIFKSGINDTTANICKYGYNRYSHSAIRQYLNSSDVGWWKSQHLGDIESSKAGSKGFLSHLDGIAAVVTPVEITAACNTVTDGGVVDTICDKFFLASNTEQWAKEQYKEGEVFEYWKELIGGSSPQEWYDSHPNAGRISISVKSKAASSCWWRACSRGNSSNVWSGSASSGGFVSSYNAYAGWLRPRPVCVITGI